ARREALVKANGDNGQSVEQLQLFADHRNSSVLQRHYLGAMNTVDGVASYLGMDIRRDLTEDFRSATMKWDSDLALQLPAREVDQLKQDEEYIRLKEHISTRNTLIDGALFKKEEHEQHIAARKQAYEDRRRFVKQKLQEYRQCATDQQSDWHRDHLSRVIHMMPERHRLLRTLAQREPLRSPTGISALEDLIALRTGDWQVAYQSQLRPENGICPVKFCNKMIESLHFSQRWLHIYRYFEKRFKADYKFAKFCFLCSHWVTDKQEWEHHCQKHIDDGDTPFRCDPVVFRHAYACAGYCPVHLGRTDILASERMKTYIDLKVWRLHISKCVTDHITTGLHSNSLKCPHPDCSAPVDSGESLWYHLQDIHSVENASPKKRTFSSEKSNHDRSGSIRFAKKQKTTSGPNPTVTATSISEQIAATMAPFAFITSPTSSTGKLTSSSQDEQCSTSSTDPSSLEDFCITKNPDSPLRHALLLDLGFPGALQPNPSHVPSFKGRSTELIDPALTELPVAVLKCDSSGDASPPNKNSANLTGPASQDMLVNIKHSPNLLEGKPAALDADNNIWEAEKLLAKWGLKKKPYYLVKWKGFPHEDNTWEPRGNISEDLIKSFESNFEGNHAGVRLLDKRKWAGNVKYLVEWKGRPKGERSWEKAKTLSSARLMHGGVHVRYRDEV
ncbi:uncharacterized protein PpBr36_11343, partial [Pyricularia pennisetigena]|uniref:uncharacterized protein n=1 Tax=Pyricularia pennisetigena TaxID=1578925 RepID=UPI00114EA0D6